LSPAKLGIIFIIAGVVVAFALLGGSLKSLFSDSITEQAVIKIKQDGVCIVEPSDKIPRQINNCQYKEGDTISVTYRQQQPSIQSHFSINNNTNNSN